MNSDHACRGYLPVLWRRKRIAVIVSCLEGKFFTVVTDTVRVRRTHIVKTIMILIFLQLLQVVWGEQWDFYHELSAETFQPPNSLREDSYFGFSITYDQFNKRMMISTPRENNIGEVYECDLTKINDKSCSKLPANITREAEAYTHDYWFGATLEAAPTYVLACTPRYTRYPRNCAVAGTFGRCYRRRENENFFNYPMFTKSVTQKDCLNMEKSMDTLGWSLDIGKDDSVIIGSPGMFQNTGIAAVLPSKKRLLKRIDKIESNIYNFGYGVAAGYFLVENKISYAVSTTYGNFGAGQVYFYIQDKNNNFDKPLLLKKGEDVDDVGSMFGAVLCVANINELGKGDDLLVGAPTYALQSDYNIGAVYVYEFKKKGDPPEYRIKIVGQKHGSMFGSTIISLGDLNGDKKDEIAIGAPYEDDGAVYIYSGAAILSDKPFRWLQKIKPSEKNLASFGYSLAALQDYDNNGCNELAVSAPFANKVKLYKCLAAVTITKMYAIFPNVTKRTVSRQTDFVFEVCIDVKYPDKPKDITADLSTDVRLDHMYATLKSVNDRNVYNFHTPLQSKNSTYCAKVDFILPLDKDYSTEIGYEISTKLLNSPMNMTHVTGAHVILSDHSKLSNSGSFWAGECSGASGCISNLSLTITSDIKERPFITGSKDASVFHVQVLNTGEVAYDPCIQLRVSGGTLQKSPMFCSWNNVLDESWLCKTMKPIRTNATWDINDIIVDLRSLTNQDKRVALKVKLFERCTDTNTSESYELSFPLRSNSDGIYIRGITDVGYVNIVENEVLFAKHFEQIYTIVNQGPTNFKDLTSNITMENTDFVTYPDIPVTIHVEGTSQSEGSHKTCHTDKSGLKMTALCQIDSLFKDSFVKIRIAMDTNPNVLTYDVLEKQNRVTVNSTLTIYLDTEAPKSLMLSTVIQRREAHVDLWILIAACLVGLLLIIVIAVILYKNGFLQRKNKKKLNTLKESVKRQTIRRSMMARPTTATEDRSEILENMEMSDEIAFDENPHPKRATSKTS
ncbi:unnamed protein product [Arctia plantaginis]|uniref:Uncharacterized protein n=1 Tax=Arctia plantaginis TaxID=874455 RepID=A0A8S0Z7R1_ARCPL|nr:unnamed protein product [Arctia plantaginis]